ncbi:tetratricopeptide repeat protein [Vibrio agarivorans]|uniref:Tetratricopeptide repeat protein n=1 Tax=Vibrio agarivorans TaxID=153622 RepID=A0ABT7XXA7_9VIBR|nr:hypothetical protein [Vibrio agarivorans]MDN2480405.1 hypothetical protein [Vibrio agarivorans]
MKNLCILLFSLLVTIGCASTSSSSLSQKDEVESMEKVNNYDGLINHYKQKLEDNPNDYTSMQSMAKAYFDKGDVESARFYSDYLIEKKVDNWQLLQMRGNIYHQDGDDVLAVEYYQRSIDRGNQSGEVQMLVGISYCMLGRYPLAERSFNKARLKGYSDTAVKNNLALVKFAERDYREVVNILGPLYISDPTNKKVQANLAIALIKLGDIQKANEVLGGKYSSRQMSQMSQRLAVVNGGTI